MWLQMVLIIIEAFIIPRASLTLRVRSIPNHRGYTRYLQLPSIRFYKFHERSSVNHDQGGLAVLGRACPSVLIMPSVAPKVDRQDPVWAVWSPQCDGPKYPGVHGIHVESLDDWYGFA